MANGYVPEQPLQTLGQIRIGLIGEDSQRMAAHEISVSSNVRADIERNFRHIAEVREQTYLRLTVQKMIGSLNMGQELIWEDAVKKFLDYPSSLESAATLSQSCP